MCFEPNHVPDKQPWYCLGVCTEFDSENKELSQRLRNACPVMPSRVNYFRHLEAAVYDPSRRVICNWDHIAVDNVGRLPASFFLRHLSDAPKEVKALLNRPLIESAASEGDERLKRFHRTSGDSRLRIRDALEGAERGRLCDAHTASDLQSQAIIQELKESNCCCRST